MTERGFDASKSAGMCTHGNFPSSCPTCSAEKREVTEGNGLYVAIREVAGHAANGEGTTLEGDRKTLATLREFVDSKRPELPESEKKNAEDFGYVSAADAIGNALQVAEQYLGRDDEPSRRAFNIAMEQAQRLVSYGSKTKQVTIKSFNANKQETFALPNIVEVPVEWEQSEKGKKFEATVRGFLDKRKSGEVVDESDLTALRGLMGDIAHVYEGVKIDAQKAKNAPLARELIMLNIVLLYENTKNYLGKQMPPSQDNNRALGLIKGLTKYNEKSYLEQKIRPGVRFIGIPSVLDMPATLMT